MLFRVPGQTGDVSFLNGTSMLMSLNGNRALKRTCVRNLMPGLGIRALVVGVHVLFHVLNGNSGVTPKLSNLTKDGASSNQSKKLIL